MRLFHWVCALFFLSYSTMVMATDTAFPHLPLLRIPVSVTFATLDPTEAEDFINVRLLENLGQGLMTLDSNLKPILGLAKHFEVSKDQKIYTFKLKDSRWSDGKTILASDFVTGFKRTLSPQTKAKISQNLQDIIVGARDYKSGLIKDFDLVGVKATDDNTLRITLNHPAPYILSLLALPFSFPQRDQNGFAIKEKMATSGPYFISELKSGKQITLTPNPYFVPQAKNQVALRFVADSTTALALYEKNELDILEKIPATDFDRLKNSREIVSAPFIATYYLGVNIKKPPFDDLTVRKTLFSAINRSEVGKILKDPQTISSSWVPEPFETSNEEFAPSLTKNEKTLGAKKLKAQPITLAFDSQEKNTLILGLIQQQIKSTIGVGIELKGFEWKSYLSYLQNENPAFFRFGWLAAFPDALSHLSIFKSNNPNNHTGWNSTEYDKLIEKISLLKPFSNKRKKLIRQAQKMLLVDNVIIFPVFHYQNHILIKSNWAGLELTPMGLLRFDTANLKHAP